MENTVENVESLKKAYQIIASKNAALTNENNKLRNQLSTADKRINVLEEYVKLSKMRHFGKKSEAHLAAVQESEGIQRQIPFFDCIETSPKHPSLKTEEKTETIKYTRRKKSKGRRIDTSKLPRERMLHDLSDAEKVCRCGKQLCKLVKIYRGS